MKYLGHIVTQDGIKPDPTLTKAVTDFPQPKTIKDVQSFLGLTGYYRRFIEDYSKVAEPLIKQLRQLKERNYHLNWNPECTTAFETLKSKLINAPIMKTPNFNEPFILELDACEYGLGAVLAQEYDKKKFVIAYASRTLSPTERNYSATEREALAIVWATQHFRPYLEGTKVLIRSDCKALQWLKNAKDVSGRWARWAMKLSALQIESIQYRPGAANANADSLSRNPVTTCIMESIGQINPKDNESEERMIRANTNTSNSLNSYEISTIETIINLWENTNILEDIKKEQQADSKLIPIIQQLKTMTPDLVNDKRQPFVLINDILYKIKNSSRHYNQRALGNKHLLVIQKVMQHKLLQWAHEHPTAGHAGQQKTLFRLSTRVYWTSMRKDIYNFVAACQECQRFKLGDNVNLGAINADRLKVYFEPLQTTSLDNTNNSGSQSDSVIRADAQLDIADDAGTQTDNASEDDAQPDITDDAATQTDNASEEDAQSDIAMPQPTNLETSMETDIINEDSDAATSIPPSSAAPAFHGKHSESPTQFLIRVQEYAESVHAWDRPTLLNGISQFLRDSALEWYCQLRMSHRRPQTWTEFTDVFLAQFNSPVRKAKQEQEWHECKQKEDKTINEFLVRLRALWREQKPKETEADLVKHLFCRMRNDLLNMIGTPRNVSLDELMAEVQQIEEILYRRAKNQRLSNQVKQSSLVDVERSTRKHYNGGRQRVYFKGSAAMKSSTPNYKSIREEEDEYTLLASECIKLPSFHASDVQ
ncbi:unnamed protein product, partial [Rotaria sp. Silwood2]